MKGAPPWAYVLGYFIIGIVGGWFVCAWLILLFCSIVQGHFIWMLPPHILGTLGCGIYMARRGWKKARH